MIQANYENVIMKLRDTLAQTSLDKIIVESAYEDLQEQHARLQAELEAERLRSAQLDQIIGERGIAQDGAAS